MRLPQGRSAADPSCKNGEHLRTQVGGGPLCVAGQTLGQSSVAFHKTLCEKNILIMSVKQADIETEAQITPKGVFLYIFSRCKYLFNYVN